MQVTVEVVIGAGTVRPAPGTPVRVEVRDVTEQDVPSVTLAGVDAAVDDSTSTTLVTVTLDVPDESVDVTRDLTVWVRVAASGAGTTSRGDFISTTPVAVPRAVPALVTVPVRPVV